MTAILERERAAVVEERQAVRTPRYTEPARSKPSRFKAWMAALVVAVVAAGAGVVAVNQQNATETLTFRAIGESEALARFVPAVSAVDAGLTFRAIGESEALERFVTS